MQKGKERSERSYENLGQEEIEEKGKEQQEVSGAVGKRVARV